MKIVEDSIRKLAQEFRKTPANFFCEADFQYRLFSILEETENNKQQIKTKDGKMVSLIHPEYPSVERVKLSSGKGYRVWFDIAVLNPKFIKQNLYETVIARDEKKAKVWGKNVKAAIELKYFPRKSNSTLSRVESDCFKLSQCSEVEDKYVLVFSNFSMPASELKKIKKSQAHLIWIHLSKETATATL